MAGNIIYITFNEDLPEGSTVNLQGIYSNGISPIVSLNPSWEWVVTRNAAYKVTTGTPTALPGERSAINFMQAFQLDYAVNGQHTVTRSGNIVTITSLYNNVQGYTWDGGIAYKPAPGFPAVADVDFAFTLDNNTTPFNFSVEYLPYTSNRCGYVNVKITATKVIKEITSPVTNLNVNSTTYTFQFLRGSAGNIVIKSNDAQPITTSGSFQSPAVLSADNFTVVTYNTPNGATLVVTGVNTQGLNLVYAITLPLEFPGVFQSSNIFSGIAPGEYKIWIRDQFLCTRSKEITVDELSTGPLYFKISKAMSLRFAQRVTLGDAGPYKIDENTLSCEEDKKIAYKEIQQFQTSDIITTQFKSNYTTNTAKVIKSDGSTDTLVVLKKSKNIGVKDKRDATKVNLGNGKTGVYFQSGNIYDYDTDAITGTYSLNGELPYWAKSGNFIFIDNIWLQIDRTYFDDTLNAEVVVVPMVYTGTPVTTIVASVYNLFNYEVYEFSVDFASYQNQRVRVEILCTSDNGQVRFVSESIEVKVRQVGTVEIKYRNSENTDVFYSTGITNLLRMPLTSKNAVPEESSETYKTDNNTILLSSEVYEVTQFIFEPVTTEMMRKLIQAFNHDTLQMDGVSYVKNGPCEVEGPLEQSNIYVVKANLIKTTGAFNGSGSGDEIFDTSLTEVPGLIDLGDGTYIKYK